ncbi:hypothetical protein WJX84_010835 [Apatococcus fuscideae]|uniref:FMN hydroxy acid dehydrogenase domain-containing protein n=1 Tax=Apatococcus fuscideae TaxID=2026836 RepID=A0AAW1RWZ0_9CHLO
MSFAALDTHFHNLHELEELARTRLSKAAFDFYAGGAEDLASLRENQVAFSRYKLLPRVLIDVSCMDTSCTLLGGAICPRTCMLCQPDGPSTQAPQLAPADYTGTAMGVSINANHTMEEVADTGNELLFFQVYVFKNRKAVRKLVQDVERKGYKGLIITVDCPTSGKREQDGRNRFALPAGLTVKNMQRVTGTQEVKSPQADSKNAAEGDQDSAYHSMHTSVYDQGLTWDFIPWLRSITKLPILLKGILSPDDAYIAVHRYGVDGLVISNHGGRQCDYVPAAVDMLPQIVEVVNRKVPIIIDGGVRRGSDVLKALALGADAVMVGRPIIYGLAVGGQLAVEAVLDMLRSELELSMKLCGCPTLSSIVRNIVIAPPAAPASSSLAHSRL